MFYFFLVVYLIGLTNVKCCLEISQREIRIENGNHIVLETSFHDSYGNGSKRTLNLISQHKDTVAVTSSVTEFGTVRIKITALSAGKSEVIVKCESNSKNETETLYILVEIYKNEVLHIISVLCGWLYFASWSACNYPQLYENYKAKSVVGLNFDTVMFGLFGYLMYNTFNVAMFYVPVIKRQYSLRYPKGISPVLANDVVFSMHGVLATSAVAYQCFVYHSEKQTVSKAGAAIVTLCSLAVVSTSVLAFFDIILWLDVAYLCSYIKMYGNIMLYCPQVFMNYKRRSTSGFSILGVIIDFMGGVFCMIQILMDGYNYDDWKTISENPTKFGIGVMTMVVCLIFMVQHYILYPKQTKTQHLEMKMQA